MSSAGGTIQMPVVDMMTLGRMCIAADPAGAVFGIWQAVDFPGAGIVNEHGALIWNELNTTDRSAAAAFYQASFGIESAAMEMAGAENYFALKVGDRPVGGMQPMPEQMPPDTPSHWLTYFSVPDTDATVEKVTAAGGAALQEPIDMVAGRMAMVTDPQGATFAVISPKSMDLG